MLALLIKLFQHGTVLTLSPLVAAQGIFLTISGLFYFYALKTLSAGLTTVILFAHPVLVAILAIIIFKEKFAPRLFVGLVFALLGIGLISGLGGNTSNLSSSGVFFAILSCICYAIYGLIGQKTVSSAGPLSISATLSLLAVIIIIPIYHNDLDFVYNLTLQQILVTMSIAIMNTLLAVFFFLKGLQKIGASRATLISTVEPVLCLFISYLILDETLKPLELIGSVLVFISMLLAVFSRPGSVSNS
jgi:drug/metabolite transporter (DMT)-like permease